MKHARSVRILAVVGLAFGVLTIASGARALFGDAAARAAVGNAVPYVLWFNFLAGFAYVAAGIGLWWTQRWAVVLAAMLALATAAIATAFGFHVLGGGAYEMRTVGALALRFGFWVVVSVVAWRSLARLTPAAPSGLG
ncbi:MAG: hypothetical protein KDH91_10270 [Rhodoferax sp.]|nr:hypothetical protein [Rhodoferax sp.]MCB2040062.1 hypothetical protein [Rhodoferax sp.]